LPGSPRAADELLCQMRDCHVPPDPCEVCVVRYIDDGMCHRTRASVELLILRRTRVNLWSLTVNARLARRGPVLHAAVHDPRHHRAVVEIEFGQDVLDVCFDGALRDGESLGDVPIAQPLGDQSGDLAFPAG
jgi:hypothetical protein